ncbi:putative RAB6A-GEF complex partner protein 2 [Hypsibius exemplaris]|uniref:RAB6A-GEF complex partner protein 2 n=1 Tax=Hypsibius exemplaris TaxID=2072580 RepID=A0A1W0WLN5_HYPEX|nr:putative RAB6A-GEF complex partner protein 2 [Hypsibius exemplaris]
MIEFVARLARGAVYFTGEELECWITLRNVVVLPPTTPPDSAGHLVASPDAGKLNGRPEGAAVAFLSGQIHCQCLVEDSKMNVPARPNHGLERQDSSGGRRVSGMAPGPETNSFCLLATIPKLLAGNLDLEPGEEFNVLFSEIVPRDAMSPSFRGLALRYQWKLAFQCQVLGQQTTTIYIPLWIMVIPDLDRLLGLAEMDGRRSSMNGVPADDKAATSVETTALTNGTNGKDSPSPNSSSVALTNGSDAVTAAKSVLTLDMAMQILDSLTSRKNARSFNIDSSHGRIGVLVLTKTRFRLGEDIYGKFDFTDRSVTCVQYLVSLIGEEHICEEHRKAKSVAFSENIVSKSHDFCLCLTQSNFILPVPLHVTSSFASEIVEFRWKLRFEFALSSEMFHLEVPSVGNENQSVLWRPPLRVPVETILWDVPIDIYPTDPIQVHSVHMRESLVSDVRVKL